MTIDIKSTVLQQVVESLNVLGVQYFIKDGENKISNMAEDLVVKKKKKSPRKYKPKEIENFITDQLRNKAFTPTIGLSFVACGDYEIESVRGSLKYYLKKTYGENQFTTRVDHKRNLVWFWQVQHEPETEFLI